MADNDELKNIKISQEDIIEATKQWKDALLKQGYSAKQIQYSIENQMEEVKKELLKKAKAVAMDKYFEKAIDKFGSELGKQAQQVKRQGTWERLVSTLSGRGNDSKDSFEQMYRVRQRFGGIEQIFAGNVGSGVSQLAGSFKGLASIMGGPYYLALKLAVTGLLEFNKHLTEVNKMVLGQTGGYASPYLYASASEKQQVVNTDRKYLRDLYMMKQEQEILSSKTSNFSLYSRQNNSDDINRGLAFNRAALQSMGIDSSTADRLTTSLMRTEGLNSNQSNFFISNMVKRIQDMGNKIILPEKQIIEETLKGFDANKKFNLSMGWVNNQVLKFNNALEKGTRTMDDFAAIQKSFYGGDTGQLAGLANIIAESSIAAGVEVPQELIQNLNNPYALKMLMSDPEVMKKLGPGLQATAKRFAVESGQYGNALAEQGFLGDILQQLLKTNVSRQAVIDLQRSGYDFVSSGLLGVGGSASVSKAPKDQQQIEQDAAKFRGEVTQYQKDITTFLSKFWSNMGKLKDDVLYDIKAHNEESAKRMQEDMQNGNFNVYYPYYMAGI